MAHLPQAEPLGAAQIRLSMSRALFIEDLPNQPDARLVPRLVGSVHLRIVEEEAVFLALLLLGLMGGFDFELLYLNLAAGLFLAAQGFGGFVKLPAHAG